MRQVLVAGKIHPAGRAVLDSAPGLTIRYIDEISEESYAPYIDEADALLIRTQPMSAATVAKASKLKIVSRHGVGYDAIDVAALNQRRIALTVCGDVNAGSVAEHTCMMVLAASKQVLRADASVRSGPWSWRDKLQSKELQGRNLLVLGYGRIGRQTASMMAGFGMSIRAYDPFLACKGWPEGPATPIADLHDGLAWADVITVSAPKTDTPLLGPQEFAAMRQGVVVVNTARGGIVNEAALVAALQSGKVAAAGIDVFEDEPPAPDNPLTQFDQVLLSPHIAGVTEGASERMATGAAQNIIDFFKGEIDPALVVNRSEIYHA